MSRMIAYTEDFFDYHCDACAGPDVPPKAIGFRTLGQQARDLRPLFGRQSRLGPRGNSAAQHFDTASFLCSLDPLAHCPTGHAQSFGDVALLPALLIQLPGSEPTTLSPVPWHIRSCSLHTAYSTCS